MSKIPTPLVRLLQAPGVKATARLHFRLAMDLPFVGEQEIVELRLSGFSDVDGDLLPEFVVDLEVLNRDVVPVEAQRIELDPHVVVAAFAGGRGAVETLFAAVVAGLAARGVSLPGA